MHQRTPHRGFTLIELMIVVAIIAILTAIAVPTYLTYVLHGRRAQAYALLERNQAMLEQCYAQNFSYTPAAPASCPAPAQTSQNGYYALAPAPATSIGATSYRLTVIPVGAQAKDTQCASFTLTSGNVRSAVNSAGADNTSTCWAR
ncbi:MAG TPA: type IV pilin protein [Rhodanobacteraceae bacterium]|nr:type IV pilin protein [Rhodanobacteraceae bacterium]